MGLSPRNALIIGFGIGLLIGLILGFTFGAATATSVCVDAGFKILEMKNISVDIDKEVVSMLLDKYKTKWG